MGSEDSFEGVIDLIKQKALYWMDENGETIIEKEIPELYNAEAHEWRMKLGDVLRLEQKFIDGLSKADKRFLRIHNG